MNSISSDWVFLATYYHCTIVYTIKDLLNNSVNRVVGWSETVIHVKLFELMWQYNVALDSNCRCDVVDDIELAQNCHTE